MNIAIFSGEISGDMIGGALAEELKRLSPETTLWGIGSGAMQAAGVELVADSSTWGAVSIVSSLIKGPGVLMKMVPALKKEIVKRRPDVVVLIDFGFFNVRAAKFCKERGIKVVYYFPPGSWRREGDRGGNLAAITDVLAVPFPWAVERYNRLGCNAVYVGHPIVERVKPEMTREEFAGHFGMLPERPIIGLLPGSRQHEVKHLMPTLINAARLIYREVKDAQFVIGVAPSISLEMMRGYLNEDIAVRDRLGDIWHEFVVDTGKKVLKPVVERAKELTHPVEHQLASVTGTLHSDLAWKERLQAQAESMKKNQEAGLPPLALAKGLTYDVMAHSSVLLTCSGTATLEATLFETPMVILYRGSKLMEIEYHLRGMKKKLTHIGLPNILAGKRIVPELIQHDATPETICKHAVEMLQDIEVRARVKHDLSTVRESLGGEGASEKTAKLVLSLIR